MAASRSIKGVRGGTPEGGIDLCRSCAYSFIRMAASGREAKVCEWNHESVLIREPIVECNKHHYKGMPQVWELEKIAWTITADVKGGKMGFAPPKKDD